MYAFFGLSFQNLTPISLFPPRHCSEVIPVERFPHQTTGYHGIDQMVSYIDKLRQISLKSSQLVGRNKLIRSNMRYSHTHLLWTNFCSGNVWWYFDKQHIFKSITKYLYIIGEKVTLEIVTWIKHFYSFLRQVSWSKE